MLDPIYITFLIVAETGSFSKTGKKLYISAVSVRKQITKIENEIGIKLFIRGSQGVRLTKAGQLLYEKTVKIKEQADKTMEKVKSIVIQDKIVINVGASMMRHLQQDLLNCGKKPEMLYPIIHYISLLLMIIISMLKA